MDYLVIIKTKWAFDAGDFRGKLLEQWPMAQTRAVHVISHAPVMDFELPMNRSTLYGTLHHQGNLVSFSGELQDCTEFAHWCRLMIPASEDVLFCDETVNVSLALKPGMSPEDIFQAVVTT